MLQLSYHITAKIRMAVSALVRTAATDGINIIIRDLCIWHICILTIEKYSCQDIYLQNLCLTYRLQREKRARIHNVKA